MNCLNSSWVSRFGSQRRWSLSLPVLTLIFPALLPCLVRDSLCTALQTKILWINWSLNAIDTIETWVSGNLTALTERSQPAIRWTRGRGGESCVCPPPPRPFALFASIRWPGQVGLTSAGSVAAGSDGCLLGRIHFPCGFVVYVLLCCWGVFPVLTLYSPRSIVWGLFFSPPFPHVNAVFFFNSTCISLLIILVWLCMWQIIKNLEPWTFG